MKIPRTQHGHRFKQGFTMLEVLIAMGIFAIGFAAVAAIFPTAVLLQKQTVDDVVGQQVARNAQALLEARGLSEGDITTELGGNAWLTDQRVHAISGLLDTGSPDEWSLADRSYPSTTNPPEKRKMLWVPLVRDADASPATPSGTSAIVYVFVLQREPDAVYMRPTPFTDYANDADVAVTGQVLPGIAHVSVTVDTSDLQRFDMGTNGNMWGSNFLIKPGDQILDCFGGIHTVQTVNANGVKVAGIINPNLDTGVFPDELWFAVPDTNGKLRPTRRILTLTDAVTP